MATLPKPYRVVLITYGALGVLLWTEPLLSILHVESCAVVAVAAFFSAGISSLALLDRGFTSPRILILQEAALLIPAFLLSVSALWQPNCDYGRGVMFFALFPGVTVVFAVAAARFVHAAPVRRKRAALTTLGIVLLILPPAFDLGFHPQFYTYNHVFGGFLGPIYDEQLAVRPGLFAFRVLTLLWSALLFAGAVSFDRAMASMRLRLAIGVCAASIVGAYVFAAELGFVTTYEHLTSELGAVHRTRHFAIHYDPERTSGEELRLMADEHEYRYDVLRRLLDIEVDRRIHSYIYPDAERKGQLTGARYTNVAPVWLSVPQTHVLESNFYDVFPHELVHVFSREFGLPILNASLSVGLVEGLAVALEPPSGRPGPDEQVSAALLAGGLPGASADRLAEVVASRLSPLGFWTGRGAVSYTTMGSFVRYLIDTYGPKPFMQAYATASFEKYYGAVPTELAQGWAEHLQSLDTVAPSAAALATARFAMPSLFEKDCPHYLPPHRELVLKAREALHDGNATVAFQAASEAVEVEENYVPALELWAGLALAGGRSAAVVDRIGRRDAEAMSPLLAMHLGDAYVLEGSESAAREWYEQALSQLPAYAHEATSRLLVRHAVAAKPDVLRLLVRTEYDGSVDISDQQIEESAAARVAAALAASRAGAHEQAADLLRTTSPVSLSAAAPYLGEELVRRRHVWLAQILYRSGVLPVAAQHADSAASAYHDVGAFNEAALMEDARSKMVWLAVKDTAGTASRSVR